MIYDCGEREVKDERKNVVFKNLVKLRNLRADTHTKKCHDC